MQYSTFAAIDIGSYDVILEIFEISKKQGIRSVDKICHRMELGKIRTRWEKFARKWKKSCAVYSQILCGLWKAIAWTITVQRHPVRSVSVEQSLCPWKNSSADRSFCHCSLQLGAAFS